MPEFRVKGEVSFTYDIIAVGTDRITAQIEAAKQVAAMASNAGPYVGQTVTSMKEIK